MKAFRIFCVLFLTIGVLALPLAAMASTGVQDPGFSYVDVNNDGLYNAADGDIAVNAQVMDGTFDTSQCEPGYTAPLCPASLVVSRSQVITPGVPICLKAGVNLIVFANLNDPTTPTMALTACRNISLTNTSVAFQNQLNINAGCDVNIDGTLIEGSGASSKVYIYAGGNLSGRPYAYMVVPYNTITTTNISAGALVDTYSCGCTYFDSADIATTQSCSAINLEASGSLEAVHGTNISANAGPVEVESSCSLVRLQGDNVSGATLEVNANATAILDGSFINTTGATTINACGPVDGLSDTQPLIVSCSCFTVCSLNCVDLDTSNIYAGSGAIEVTGLGDVTANSASWTATTRIDVKSTLGHICARTAYMDVLTPRGPITFCAGGLCIDVTGSVFIGTVTYGPLLLVRVIGP